jgi:hypothetical protein
MKHLAAIVAVMLSLTLVAPAFAQPFADVPTDHWAYDAIAELAAKGLIEGYPDGAFRGDRAMTRYEMAMVVARLLARIEAIKIPPLPADLVRTAQLNSAVAAQTAATRAVDARVTALTTKLATVQRLVAEFRAELAALGVRVTAVEEELAAIRARLDNTRVTGDIRFRYNVYPTGSVSGSGTFRHPDVRMRARITFTGRVASNVDGVVRIWAANNAFTGSAFDERFGGGLFFNAVTYDFAYVDIRGVLAANWRIGRQPYTLGITGIGGGLLFDPINSAGAGSGGLYFPGQFGAAAQAGVLAAVVDGIRGTWNLGPLTLELAQFAESVSLASTGLLSCATFPLASTCGDRQFQVARVTTGALLPGWTLGGHYFRQGASPANGVLIQPYQGSGWGADISGTLFPGVRVYADWASWRGEYPPNPAFAFPGITFATVSAWRVGGNISLAQVAGIETWNPSLDLEYHNYGGPPPGAGNENFFGWLPPRYSYATTIFGQAFDWNMRGWLARLNLTFAPGWTGFVLYEGGTVISTGAPYSEWWLRLQHTVAPRTNVYIQYTRGTVGGADYFNFYRAELNTAW